MRSLSCRSVSRVVVLCHVVLIVCYFFTTAISAVTTSVITITSFTFITSVTSTSTTSFIQIFFALIIYLISSPYLLALSFDIFAALPMIDLSAQE